MWRQGAAPGVQFLGQFTKTLEGELVGCLGRVDLFEYFGQDAAGTEQSEGTREFGRLARQSRLEAAFGDVLVICVHGEFAVDVVVFELSGKT